MAEPVILNALQLRLLAEQASGRRGERLNVYGKQEDGRADLSVGPADAVSDFFPPLVMELDTRYQASGREMATVTIKTDEMTEPEPLWSYDAVFWSEAAVEKFVFPYYASKMLWMAPLFLAVLAKYWYGFVPGEDQTRERRVVRVDGEEMVPFAVAHLPTSDYILLYGDEVGADLHLLFRRSDGSVYPRSLAELLRAEREAGGQNG